MLYFFFMAPIKTPGVICCAAGKVKVFLSYSFHISRHKSCNSRPCARDRHAVLNAANSTIWLDLPQISTMLSAAVSLRTMWCYRSSVPRRLIKRTGLQHWLPVIKRLWSLLLVCFEYSAASLSALWTSEMLFILSTGCTHHLNRTCHLLDKEDWNFARGETQV